MEEVGARGSERWYPCEVGQAGGGRPTDRRCCSGSRRGDVQAAAYSERGLAHGEHAGRFHQGADLLAQLRPAGGDLNVDGPVGGRRGCTASGWRRRTGERPGCMESLPDWRISASGSPSLPSAPSAARTPSPSIHAARPHCAQRRSVSRCSTHRSSIPLRHRPAARFHTDRPSGTGVGSPLPPANMTTDGTRSGWKCECARASASWARFVWWQ